jgi:hypothetical protein
MNVTRSTLLVLAIILLKANSYKEATVITKKEIASAIIKLPESLHIADCYAEWNLTAKGVSESAFNYAVKGYNYLQIKNLLPKKNVLTIIDYSQPSNSKRLFVIDMISGKILFNTLVAHGKNSGLEYAEQFSNEEESHKTSLGVFITGQTYIGENGYSLQLSGCEKGINDKAKKRAIVIHGAAYANEDFLQSNGYLGRSYGCPALPQKISKKIIDVIKNGSCVFLYHPTKKYTTLSKILNS